MKISDEQLKQAGKAITEAGIKAPGPTWSSDSTLLAMGSAALTACAEILLAEPTDREINSVIGPVRKERCWMKDDYDRVRLVFSKRLRSITAPEPDAAVEAVSGRLQKVYQNNELTWGANIQPLAAEIVAAVREADKAGAK